MIYSNTQSKGKEISIIVEETENCIYTNPTDFLVSFFNFWYYIGVCPFRFKFCHKSQSYEILKSWKQIMHSSFVMMLTTVFLVTCIRSIYIEHNVAKELNYFAISKACGSIVTCGCFFITIWKSQTKFESLINKYLSRNYTYTSYTNYPNFFQVKYLAPILMLIITILSVLTFSLSFIEENQWDFDEIYKKLVHQGQTLFAMHLSKNCKMSYNSSPLAQNLFIGVYLVSFLHYHLVDTACQMLVVICAFSLMSSLTPLQKSLPNDSISEGFSQYSLLKEISQLNNKAVGLTVFGVVFGYIPFFMHSIPEIIQPKGPFVFIQNIISVSMPFTFLILAAKIMNKTYAVFGDFLTMAKTCDNQSELSIFIFELSRQEIGFSVGGFIKLTPSFFGAVISLVLTFAVVIIQFSSQKV